MTQKFLAVCCINPFSNPTEERFRHYFCKSENAAVGVCKDKAKSDGEVKAVWVFKIFEKLLTPKLMLGTQEDVKKHERIVTSYAKSAQSTYFKDGLPEDKKTKPRIRSKALTVVSAKATVKEVPTYKTSYNLKEAKVIK